MRPTNSVIGAAILFAVASTASAQAVPRLDHRELASDQQVIQALNRLTFGPRPGEAQKVRAMGLDKWIDLQLHPEKIDDTPFERFADRYDILKQDQNDLLKQYADAQRERRMVKRDKTDSTAMSREDRMAIQQIGLARRQFMGQLQSERVARAVASNRQLEEVMTDFWLNHFNVFAGKGPPEAYYLVEYERDVIRPNALGKFRDLLEAVAKSPAMLFYLDNARSMADSTRPRLASQRRGGVFANQPRLQQLRNGGLNENYGRELLELHTLGVDGGYTQQDVINVARALTGWTIRPPVMGGGFIFRPEMHDAGDKVVLGHKLASGRGIEDGEDVLDIVAKSPSTARFIATKLARRFVSDNPPSGLVDRVATTFTRSQGDIREMLRTIFFSPEFNSADAYRVKIKRPFELTISAIRTLGGETTGGPQLHQWIARMGEPLYGFQTPNGYSDLAESWVNTGGLLERFNFGLTLASNRIPGTSVDLKQFVSSGDGRSLNKDQIMDRFLDLIVAGDITPKTKAALLKQLDEQATLVVPAMSAETSRSNDGMANESNSSMDRELPFRQRGQRQQLARADANISDPMTKIVGLILGSPEFQRQ